MVDINQKVSNLYPKLTKRMKLAAEYLLHNPLSFATKTAEKVAEEIGISETTVIRFCNELGYKRYGDFQSELREFLYDASNPIQHFRESKKDIGDVPLFHQQVMYKDIENIQRVAEQISESDFNKAIEKLLEADRILHAGLYQTGILAEWFSYNLEIIRGNSRVFRPDTIDAAIRINEMTTESVLVAFSFHRYALDTLWLAEELKEKGVFIIGITDSDMAPISEFADILFKIELPLLSTLDAIPPTFSLLNAISAALTVRAGNRNKPVIPSSTYRKKKQFL
ncbi:MurR/RpiR family transcriptional regulator [Brevibacillus panacihumi]|uniref:MurR/RpiR family transcriptional regulator n=1 Tax=Brevibacillus panacihumi TaxID=497735 RepID=A0A3M8D4B2_9BACL|nr:MurR/RpiR family transcriptional regulator [Brevibacillus panacihumi]RNB82926.1 MurR/RpiR family transcriptional regulator [Brevibacillus panacihumi]